jgi:hypothetical protein
MTCGLRTTGAVFCLENCIEDCDIIEKNTICLIKVSLKGVIRLQRVKFMFQQFLHEPLWFKLLISSTLLISIIFSSSLFSSNPYYQGGSKLAAAIFFGAYGLKFKRNRVTSVLFFTVAALCIYLSISYLA